MSDDMFLDMLGEQVPTEGLGGDRPYGPPTEVIEIGKADALTGTARLTADGAGPETQVHRHYCPECGDFHVCHLDMPWWRPRLCAYPDRLCRPCFHTSYDVDDQDDDE